MASFLSKWGSNPKTSRKHSKKIAKPKEKLTLRDPNDPRIVYKISARARRVSLRVRDSEREVEVVVPGKSALKLAYTYAKENMDWINIQLEALPPAQPFVPGAQILLRGETYTLDRPDTRERPRIDHANRRIFVPAPDEEAFSGRVRRLLIREARQELEAATHFYADKLSKKVGKISVRDTSSRWGSCITRKGEGHISYSWRLISAPPYVLEYVAAHECAHLVEANHSASFWAVCESISEDVKPAKKWLRKNGALLHAVGADF